MAFTAYGNSATASNTLRERLAARIDVFRAQTAQRRVYRQTVNELSALSNRDLADLGLSRSDIRGVAFEAAYDK